MRNRPSSRRAMAIMASLGALSACPGAPDACTEMCANRLVAQEACLARDGRTWEDYAARGWPDPDAFLGACETWAFEGRQLQRDAWWRGELQGHDLSDTCETWDAALVARGSTCEALESQGWDLPWEASDDGA